MRGWKVTQTYGDTAAMISDGTTKPAHQPGGKHWTVLLDPSGQPFCISAARKRG